MAILSQTVEQLPCLLFEPPSLSGASPVRVRLESRGSGVPLKVKFVCLPFVMVKPPTGSERLIDIRLTQLARLDDRFARAVRQKLRLSKTPTSVPDPAVPGAAE